MSTTSDDEMNVAVRMSSLVLRLLLNQRASDETLPPLVSVTADALLRDMLELAPNFHAASLEVFHAQFEVLRSELWSVFRHTRALKLGALYPGALVPATPASRAMLDELVPMRVRTLKRDDHVVTPKMTRAWCLAHVNDVVLPAAKNPGFDVVLPMDGNRVLAIDTKFTQKDVDKKSRVNAKQDVLKPRTRLDEELGKLSGLCYAMRSFLKGPHFLIVS
jgi:hypothetical protein